MNKELIAKLAAGEIAVKNDGTLEELKSVLRAAFPKDESRIGGRYKYYYALSSDKWDCSDDYKHSFSVSEFLTEDEKIGQEPAFPTYEQQGNPICWNTEIGMSKRFYAACAAMQGILANSPDGVSSVHARDYANMAYDIADELLKQENK